MKIHLGFAVLIATLVSISMPTSFSAQPGNSVSPQPKLQSRVFLWSGLGVKPTAAGERRDVTDAPTPTLEQFECHVTTLNPGEVSHAPHQHPQEELIILKSGTLEFSINGVTRRAGAGSLVFFASYDLHAAHNVGDTAATYYVINFFTRATRRLAADPALAGKNAGKLPSRVYDWSQLAVMPTLKGARRDFFDSPTLTFANLESHATTLRAAESPHDSHHHADEELVVVKEGRLEVTINGVNHLADQGSVVFFASNDEHGLKNIGTTDATYYIIRVLTPISAPTDGQ